MGPIKKKVTSVRTKHNLSQAKFAEKLGFSQGYISDVESGRAKPSRNLLDAISTVYGISIDWLMQEHQIAKMIEANKNTSDPDILFLYAFTQDGIDGAEIEVKKQLTNYNCLSIDASGIKSGLQFLKKLLNEEGNQSKLWKRLKDMLLNEGVVVIIKNMSKSKIPSSGGYIRSFFKILDDAWDIENASEQEMPHKMPPSTIIVLDFPSYLEKNMENFGFYVAPIYVGSMVSDRLK